MRVVNLPAEHLQAATNTQNLAAVAQVAGDGDVPALLAQPREIGAHTLGARQDDQVARRYRLARPDEGQLHLRVQP